MTEAFTHRGVGQVYVAQGIGNFDEGDLLIYDTAEGLRVYHPKGTWVEYTVRSDGSCRVVLAREPVFTEAEGLHLNPSLDMQ